MGVGSSRPAARSRARWRRRPPRGDARGRAHQRRRQAARAPARAAPEGRGGRWSEPLRRVAAPGPSGDGARRRSRAKRSSTAPRAPATASGAARRPARRCRAAPAGRPAARARARRRRRSPGGVASPRSRRARARRARSRRAARRRSRSRSRLDPHLVQHQAQVRSAYEVRLLTVPSGMPLRSAISRSVSPPVWARRITSRCSGVRRASAAASCQRSSACSSGSVDCSPRSRARPRPASAGRTDAARGGRRRCGCA